MSEGTQPLASFEPTQLATQVDQLKAQAERDATRLAADVSRVEKSLDNQLSGYRTMFLWMCGVVLSSSALTTWWTAAGYQERFGLMEKNVNNVIAGIEKLEQDTKEAINQHETDRQQWSIKIDEAKRRYIQFAASNRQSHGVMMLLADARHHLAAGNDPRRCIELAERALANLERAMKDVGSDYPEIQSSLAAIKPDVLLTLCEGAMYAADYTRLERHAQLAVDLNCDCPDATYFLGRAKLHLALDLPRNDPNRHALLEKATSLLENTSWKYGPHSIRSLILCAAHLESNHFKRALQIAKAFPFVDSAIDERRLTDSLQSWGHLAKAMEHFSQFQVIHGTSQALVPLDCETAKRGSLSFVDSKLFEDIFDSLIARREEIFQDPYGPEEGAVFCGSVIAFVRRTCAGDPAACANCAGEGESVGEMRKIVVPEDIVLKHAIPPYALARLSKNKTLGREDNGTLVMRFQVFSIVDDIVEDTKTNTQVVRQRPQIVTEEQVFDTMQDIPLRHYVPIPETGTEIVVPVPL